MRDKLAHLKAVLDSRSKEDLIDLLLDIFSLYPDWIGDLEILTASKAFDPEAGVAQIFEALEPDGYLTADEAAVRLRLIARRADRLAEQGQVETARRIYYELIVNCVQLFTPYGHDLISPYDIPYDFAVAYVDLARLQLGQHRAAIEAEVRDMNRGEFIEEMFDLAEALSDIEQALSWQVELKTAPA